MSWKDVLDPENGFIKDESITLEVVDHSLIVLFKLTLLVFFFTSLGRLDKIFGREFSIY